MDPTALPEIGNQDFSLVSLFLRADIIVQMVMGALLIASVWSWAVAIDKWFGVGAAKSRARKFEKAFWAGQPIDEMSDRASDKGSDAMARVFVAGSREWRESRRLATATEAQTAALIERARAQMQVAVSRESERMESGLGTLAIIASSAPFIGLFGTVIGIMNAFRDIAAARETNLAVVAPGIAEALFATAMGLGAAIPALIFYNKFSGDIAKFTDRLDLFAQEFGVRLSRRLTERRDD
ncbi:MAG: protein TolQ [Alphaproteobacteria bacterium]|nr:protein TolQ [Alphaproteobacteria bacterium]